MPKIIRHITAGNCWFFFRIVVTEQLCVQHSRKWKQIIKYKCYTMYVASLILWFE